MGSQYEVKRETRLVKSGLVSMLVFVFIFVFMPKIEYKSSANFEASMFTATKWIEVKNWERAAESIELADDHLESVSDDEVFQVSRIQSYEQAKSLIFALKGIVFQAVHELDSAIVMWEMALELYQDPGALIGIAYANYNKGNLLESEEYFKQASKVFHSDFFVQQMTRSSANVGLSQIYLLNNDASNAIQYATKALVEMPSNRAASLQLAKSYVDLKHYDEAERVLNHPYMKVDIDAIILKSEIVRKISGYYAASDTLWKNMKYPEIRNNANAAGSLLLKIAIKERKWGNLSKALKALKMADHLTPAIEGDHRREERGWIDIRQGKYEEAVLKFRFVLERDPTRKFAILGLVEAYFEMGQLFKAIQLLNYLQDMTKKTKLIHRELLSWVRFFWGRYFEAIGESELAISEYGKAVSLYGNNFPARIRTGALYLRRDDCDNAAPYFYDVLNFDPKNSIALQAISRCQRL